MENENLVYWKFQVEMNQVFISTQKEVVEMAKKALLLIDAFDDKDLKTLMGGRALYTDLVTNGEACILSFTKALLMSETQLKFYTVLQGKDVKDINDHQKN